MRFVHYSANPNLNLDGLYSVKQFAITDKGINHSKPFGLWFSDDDERENWLDWCKSEDYMPTNLTNSYLAKFDLSKILHIKNVDELVSFHRNYKDYPYKNCGYTFIDWNKVAHDYMGIIISPYQWKKRYSSEVDWYYGWDVASACIWDMSAIKSFEKIKGE